MSGLKETHVQVRRPAEALAAMRNVPLETDRDDLGPVTYFRMDIGMDDPVAFEVQSRADVSPEVQYAEIVSSDPSSYAATGRLLHRLGVKAAEISTTLDESDSPLVHLGFLIEIVATFDRLLPLHFDPMQVVARDEERLYLRIRGIESLPLSIEDKIELLSAIEAEPGRHQVATRSPRADGPRTKRSGSDR